MHGRTTDPAQPTAQKMCCHRDTAAPVDETGLECRLVENRRSPGALLHGLRDQRRAALLVFVLRVGRRRDALSAVLVCAAVIVRIAFLAARAGPERFFEIALDRIARELFPAARLFFETACVKKGALLGRKLFIGPPAAKVARAPAA